MAPAPLRLTVAQRLRHSPIRDSRQPSPTLKHQAIHVAAGMAHVLSTAAGEGQEVALAARTHARIHGLSRHSHVLVHTLKRLNLGSDACLDDRPLHRHQRDSGLAHDFVRVAGLHTERRAPLPHPF